jgi:S1/P1 Nuclease
VTFVGCVAFTGLKWNTFSGRYTDAMVQRFLPKCTLFASFCVVLGLFSFSPAAWAWGNEGHRMINRLAAMNLPPDAPAFLRTQAALDEIEYLGPEPDRWRSPAEPELNAAQAPEHFLDLELADALGPLPHRRFDFEALAFAHGQNPAKIGLQPWEATEVWERLKAAFRDYRHLSADHKDTQPVEQAIIFYIGWLGHYVGDASQPLHTTVKYNGWVGPNPNGYTTAHTIHWQFEGPFVAANIHLADIQPKMTPLHVLEGDIFDDYMAYLRHTATYVEEVYKLEKVGGFEGKGTEASRDFTAERLAAGASMLRDMVETAWVDSAQPVIDPYAK